MLKNVPKEDDNSSWNTWDSFVDTITSILDYVRMKQSTYRQNTFF
jgi:hypothetical protein